MDPHKAEMRGRYLTTKQVARGRRLLMASHYLQRNPGFVSAAKAAALNVYMSAWTRI